MWLGSKGLAAMVWYFGAQSGSGKVYWVTVCYMAFLIGQQKGEQIKASAIEGEEYIDRSLERQLIQSNCFQLNVKSLIDKPY